MYADRLDTGGRSSIKDRLNGGTAGSSGRRRQITGKRQRQEDDKWEHDLYKHQDPQVSNPKLGVRDLRLKLQKKLQKMNIQQATQSSKGLPTLARDLREKLSGTAYSQQVEAPPKRKPVLESSKPARKSVVTAEAPLPETKRVAGSVSKEKTQQKAETVDTFLHAIGLEKYLITFQAEEVDMTALLHMTDEDLKVMGIPMGPRKKILLAMEAKA